MKSAAELAELCAVTEAVKAGNFLDKAKDIASAAGTHLAGAGIGAAGGALLGAGAGYARSYLHDDPDLSEATRKKHRLSAVLRAAGIGAAGGAVAGAVMVRPGAPKLTTEQATTRATRELLEKTPEAGNAAGTALDPRYGDGWQSWVRPGDGWAGYPASGAGAGVGVAGWNAYMSPAQLERNIALRRSMALAPEFGRRGSTMGLGGAAYNDLNELRLKAPVPVGTAADGTQQLSQGMSDAELQAYRAHISSRLSAPAGASRTARALHSLRTSAKVFRAKLPFRRAPMWTEAVVGDALSAAGNASEQVTAATTAATEAGKLRLQAVDMETAATKAKATAQKAVDDANALRGAARTAEEKLKATALRSAAQKDLTAAVTAANDAAAKVTAARAAEQQAATVARGAGAARANDLRSSHMTRMNMEGPGVLAKGRNAVLGTEAKLTPLDGAVRRARTWRGRAGFAPSAIAGWLLTTRIVNQLQGQPYRADLAARIAELTQQQGGK